MTLQEMVTEILAGEYAQDFLGYGKDSSGNYHPIEVDVDGKQYVIDEQLATKLDTLIAKDFATETKLEAVRALLELVEGKDFATETTLDTRLNSLETKIDTLNGKIDSVNTNINDSQDSDNNINVSQKGSKVIILDDEEPINIPAGSFITYNISSFANRQQVEAGFVSPDSFDSKVAVTIRKVGGVLGNTVYPVPQAIQDKGIGRVELYGTKGDVIWYNSDDTNSHDIYRYIAAI